MVPRVRPRRCRIRIRQLATHAATSISRPAIRLIENSIPLAHVASRVGTLSDLCLQAEPDAVAPLLLLARRSTRSAGAVVLWAQAKAEVRYTPPPRLRDGGVGPRCAPPARCGTGVDARGAAGARQRARTARPPAQAPATATHAAMSGVSRDLGWQSDSCGTSFPPRNVGLSATLLRGGMRPKQPAAHAAR